MTLLGFKRASSHESDVSENDKNQCNELESPLQQTVNVILYHAIKLSLNFPLTVNYKKYHSLQTSFLLLKFVKIETIESFVSRTNALLVWHININR